MKYHHKRFNRNIIFIVKADIENGLISNALWMLTTTKNGAFKI